MRKFATVALAFVATGLLVVPASAQPPAGDCMVGPGLGATLLFPYFEVDVDDFDGPNTLISINNGSSVETLARVVLWTDWGNPTVAFDLYLEGFDIQTLSLRDVFNGNLPSTGEGVDLSAFEFCDSQSPAYSNPVFDNDERQQLFADHTGGLGPLSSDCAGGPQNDLVARGYITVDTVRECSGAEGFEPLFTPANVIVPYFANGTASGIATNDNRLWGDIIYVTPGEASAQGSAAVSIWADANMFDGTDTFTFYGRLSAYDGRDDRVPLPSLWDLRFFNGGPFAGGSELVVWRDTEVPPQFVSCGEFPSWFPLATGSLISTDEQADNLVSYPIGDHLPSATQRVNVDSLGIPYNFGLLLVNTTNQQTWSQPVLTAGGLYSAGFIGTPTEFLCGVAPN